MSFKHRVCPWWLGWFLVSPVRRLWQDPSKILSPYIQNGMLALEPGPGMGFFTLEIARRVGPSGRVVAVDVQPKMLKGLRRRLSKARLLDRVDIRVVQPHSLGLPELTAAVDFALAFDVVHELPSPGSFFKEIALYLKPDASLLCVEPTGHVSASQFNDELTLAYKAGLCLVNRPSIRGSQAALLRKVREGGQ